MLKNLTLWIAFFPLLLLSSCSCSGESTQPQVSIGEHVWCVEIADDEQTHRQGLAGRDEIPEGTGMLFVFPREEVLTFHMLDCRAAIDIAFISSDGIIVKIETMAVEKAPQNAASLPLYSSVHPAQYALEVAAGTFKQLDIKPGDKVKLPNLHP